MQHGLVGIGIVTSPSYSQHPTFHFACCDWYTAAIMPVQKPIYFSTGWLHYPLHGRVDVALQRRQRAQQQSTLSKRINTYKALKRLVTLSCLQLTTYIKWICTLAGDKDLPHKMLVSSQNRDTERKSFGSEGTDCGERDKACWIQLAGRIEEISSKHSRIRRKRRYRTEPKLSRTTGRMME